ncbi:MAG: hypothetical protein ACRBBV_17620 [Paracoccaceae bacterium]
MPKTAIKVGFSGHPIALPLLAFAKPARGSTISSILELTMVNLDKFPFGTCQSLITFQYEME